MEQVNLFGDKAQPKRQNLEFNKQKRKWQNAFQKWSNKQFVGADTEHYGKCGYGNICDYCTDNSYGRPCVRALNEMIKEITLIIDYENMSEDYFEEIF